MIYNESDFDDAHDEMSSDKDVGLWNVYFLSLRNPREPAHDFGLVKVGFTKKDVEKRIEQLQTGNPYQIVCEDRFSAPAFVARQVEHWIHRTNASSIEKLEWLRLRRSEIAAFVELAKQQAERLADIAAAKARWSQSESNGKERPPEPAELRLHADAQGVNAELRHLKLQLRQIRARLALTAGKVYHIPGIVRISLFPQLAVFDSETAFKLFRPLASQFIVEKVRGEFHWRNRARRSMETGRLQREVDSLVEQRKHLDAAMLATPSEVRDQGERTTDLAQLHGIFLDLLQKEMRLKVDLEDIG